MLSVEPAWQGRGLGRQLVAAAEEHCRSAGCAFLDLDVVDVRTELPGFYRLLGFAPFDTAPFPDQGKLLGAAYLVLMTKPLHPGRRVAVVITMIPLRAAEDGHGAGRAATPVRRR